MRHLLCGSRIEDAKTSRRTKHDVVYVKHRCLLWCHDAGARLEI